MREPAGMMGSKLEVKVHVVTASIERDPERGDDAESRGHSC